MIHFDIITLFPKMFDSPFAESIVNRAKNNNLLKIKTHQLRDYATDKHKTVDDTPYGGGAGMVLKIDVVDRAIDKVISDKVKSKSRIIMLSASGERFTQKKAIELAKYDNIVLLCGHYEGFDQRVHDYLVDEEISIGDYVLTGGEIPAMVIIDAVTRMIPGAIREESALNESFMPKNTELRIKNYELSNKRSLGYDYPVYTRPVEYKGWKVPDILQSGNHAEIDKWRKEYHNNK